MTDLKRLYLDDRTVDMVYGVDYYVSLYPEPMPSLRYVQADIDWLMMVYNTPLPPAPKKQKHTSDLRTNSARKWAGHKKNKPKYNWSKKRKARGGWKV